MRNVVMNNKLEKDSLKKDVLEKGCIESNTEMGTDEIQNTNSTILENEKLKKPQQVEILELEQAKVKVASSNRRERYERDEIEVEYLNDIDPLHVVGVVLFIVAIIFTFTYLGKSDHAQEEDDVVQEDINVDDELDENSVLQTNIRKEALKSVEYISFSDYNNIEVVIEGVTNIDDDYITTHINEKLDKYTRLEEVDAEAKRGNTVNVDCDILVDGRFIDEIGLEGYDLVLGSDTFIAGVEEGLIGSKAGDKVSIQVIFPEDSNSADVAGKRAIVDVTVNAVKEEIRLELIDENVAYLSETAKSINEYITELKKELEVLEYDLSDENIRAQVWNQFLKGVSVSSYPEEDMQLIKESKIVAITEQATNEGTNLEDYIRSKNMTSDDFEAYILGLAEQEYLIKHAVYHVVIDESLEPTQEEYDQKIKEILEGAGYPSIDDANALGYTIEDIELKMLTEIVITWLVKHAEIIEQ